jgi:predicted transcriptional regulator
MARAALEWSQGDLAEAAKVRQETVSGFERGSDARASTVAKMREALEGGGVIFISAGEASIAGGFGVRLKAASA